MGVGNSKTTGKIRRKVESVYYWKVPANATAPILRFWHGIPHTFIKDRRSKSNHYSFNVFSISHFHKCYEISSDISLNRSSLSGKTSGN